MSQNFVLDSNIFIEASRRYYPFDFAMPFWIFLVDQASNRNLLSIDKVYDEITNGNDELKDWITTIFQPYFVSTQSSDILLAYQNLVQHIDTNSQYNQRAKDVFMEVANADTWILAYALAKNAKIVTHEVIDPNVKKRVPIPNVCVDFNIDYCDSFAMLRSLNFTF